MNDAGETHGDAPLAGVRVVELGAWVAGPAVGAILADWGAEVIKVEPLSGDPIRHALRSTGSPVNPPFELDNRGKHSIAVDVGSEGGQEVFDALLATADVFVTNLRPSVLDRWGLAPSALLDRHPRLIVATLTGFGERGPHRDRPSYDIGAFWAASGAAAAHDIDGEPVLLRSAFGDHQTAMALAGGISAALFHRTTTGRGRHVSTSLLRNGWYAVSQDVAFLSRYGTWFPYGRADASNPLFNAYPTLDGRWLWLLGLQPDRHWPSIATAMGHPEWLADERFADAFAQREHRAELLELLTATFRERTLEEWTVALEELDVWWEPVRTIDEMLTDEQLLAAGGMIEMETADGGTAPMTATPVDFDGRSRRNDLPPPALGEHTDALLRELGFDDAAIDELKRQDVVS